MNDFYAALGGTVTAVGVGMVAAGRYWPTRVRDVDDSLLDELLGPEHPYTEFEHAPSPIAYRFNPCPACDRDTVSIAHRDGSWTCGECLTTSGVAS